LDKLLQEELLEKLVQSLIIFYFFPLEKGGKINFFPLEKGENIKDWASFSGL
jgi:hypothetical protein